MHRTIEWATGLFEGEGSISARTRTGPSRTDGTGERRPFIAMELALGMTDRDVVEDFVGVIGHGSVHIRNRDDRRRTIYTWSIAGPIALDTYARMRPMLGRRRRARGDEVSAQVAESRRAFAHPARACGTCGLSFVPSKQITAAYCSDKCRDRAKYLLYKSEGRAPYQVARRRRDALHSPPTTTPT